jgi:hypothetical protein
MRKKLHMSKTVVNTTNTSENKGGKTMNKEQLLMLVEGTKDIKRDVLIIGEQDKLKKQVENLELAVKTLTDLKGNDKKKIETRIKWLKTEIAEIEKAGLENKPQTPPQDAPEQIILDSVASEKNDPNKPNTKTVNKSKNKGNKGSKEDNKPLENKDPKEDLKKDPVEVTSIPVIEPAEKFYITLETKETFLVIYKDANTTVLQDKEGVIQCNTSKFNKGIVYYFINNKPYVFDIIESYKVTD